MNEYGKYNITEGEYVSERLSTEKDDRCDEVKKSADAYLRGRIGTRKANEIIALVDGLKSRR